MLEFKFHVSLSDDEIMLTEFFATRAQEKGNLNNEET